MADSIFAVSTEREEWEPLDTLPMTGAFSSAVQPQSQFSPAIPPHANLQALRPMGGVAPNRDVTAVQVQVVRNTYKSCDFCAKRKRRCDGDGINRCRFVACYPVFCFVLCFGADDASSQSQRHHDFLCCLLKWGRGGPGSL